MSLIKHVVIFGVSVMSLNPMYSSAQEAVEKIANEIVKVQERVSIRVEDLPEPVKNAIRNGMYEGWKITDAYRITRDDQSQYFELTIAKGEENSKLKLDKNGQTIE